MEEEEVLLFLELVFEEDDPLVEEEEWWWWWCFEGLLLDVEEGEVDLVDFFWEDERFELFLSFFLLFVLDEVELAVVAVAVAVAVEEEDEGEEEPVVFLINFCLNPRIILRKGRECEREREAGKSAAILKYR